MTFEADLQRIKIRINKRSKKVLKTLGNRANMTKFVDKGADMIRLRTRLGFGVKKAGGPKSKLEKLEESTKERRKRMELSNQATARRSNLTESGKMLDSIKGKYVRQGEGSISPTGRHGKGLTNVELASYHDKLGAGKKRKKRPFFRFSKSEFNQMKKMINKKFRDLMRKNFRG